MNEHVKYLYYYFLMEDKRISINDEFWVYIDKFNLDIWEDNHYINSVIRFLKE